MAPYQTRLFGDVRPPTGSRERVDVKLWLLDDSKPKAVHMLVEPDHFAKKVWVPRSLMGDHISKRRDPGCPFQSWEFTLPLWKAEELGIKYE